MKMLKTALGIMLAGIVISLLLIAIGFILLACLIAVPANRLLDSELFRVNEEDTETECERAN